jgi:hypothetical protein
MAAEWIKLRTDLQGDPAVIRLSTILKLDAYAIVGRLAAVWVWADTHANRHGVVTLVSRSCLDSVTACAGFGEAMESVGWLKSLPNEGDGIAFPHFDRHMGEGAKQRAMASKRKKNQRMRESRERHDDVTQKSRSKRDKTVTREEKRREDTKERAKRPLAAAAEPPPESKPARARDPLFDAIAEVAGVDPATGGNGSNIGKVAAGLRRAEPAYTPEEVREFGQRFGEFCSWGPRDGRMRPTVNEIEKYIGGVRAGPAPTQNGHANGRPPATKKTHGEMRDDAYVRGIQNAMNLPEPPSPEPPR